MNSLIEILENKSDLKSTTNWLRTITQLTPDWVIRKSIEVILNNRLSVLREEGELDFLQGKILNIEVSDLNLSLNFSLVEGDKRILVQVIKWHPIFKDKQVYDSKLSGRVHAFIWLISQRYDADTLFFKRHLSILGDTELSLTLKNLLDSLEPETLMPSRLFAVLQKTAVKWDDERSLKPL